MFHQLIAIQNSERIVLNEVKETLGVKLKERCTDGFDKLFGSGHREGSKRGSKPARAEHLTASGRARLATIFTSVDVLNFTALLPSLVLELPFSYYMHCGDRLSKEECLSGSMELLRQLCAEGPVDAEMFLFSSNYLSIFDRCLVVLLGNVLNNGYTQLACFSEKDSGGNDDGDISTLKAYFQHSLWDDIPSSCFKALIKIIKSSAVAKCLILEGSIFGVTETKAKLDYDDLMSGLQQKSYQHIFEQGNHK